MDRANRINLIFDFDGTLVDSFYAAMQKINLIAHEYNFRKIDPAEIEGLKNLTSRELIKYLQIPLLKLPRVLRRAREQLRHEIPFLAIFTDLPEILMELHRLDCFLGILTSNSSENVIAWLDRYQIRHLFTFIHAGSSYFGKKTLIKKIMKTHQMEPLRTFYIGDETRDIEASQKCRIHSIAVTWGFNSVETLMRYKPSYIAKTPKEILTIIQGHAV